MQQHGSKYFACSPLPLPTLGMGSIGQNSIFQNIVMLYIKLNGLPDRSKYFARRPLTTPLTLGVGSKFNFSQHGHIACNVVANVLPADPHPPLTLGIQFFSEHGHVEYQIKGNLECSNMVANILHLPTRP